MNESIKEELFLESANTLEGINSISDFNNWYVNYYNNNEYKVDIISLDEMRSWGFDPLSGNINHDSGKFYSIEGLRVKTNFGQVKSWEQPIINQPEIGILGFLTKKFDGILHFLVQAKMEPGNVNSLQISPTVQATKSNYTQVHGGLKTKYLEYFLNPEMSRVYLDQLQSEQGSRFFIKRNRNMIVSVDEKENIETFESFFWLTLGQILEIIKKDNIINMDSRTVLSGIRFTKRENLNINKLSESLDNAYPEQFYLSSCVFNMAALYDFDSIISWITKLKSEIEISVKRIPMKDLKDWVNDGTKIRHKDKNFFSVIGASVSAGDREVTQWDQPLINSVGGGIHCFLVRKFSGILHFLVQAKVEPGNLDIIELAPTIQCSLKNYINHDSNPPFTDLIQNIPPEKIIFDSFQSEEGGRFYHDQNRYIIAEVGKNEIDKIESNYIWMTLGQIKELIRFNNYFNIEARGLLSCLSIKKPN